MWLGVQPCRLQNLFRCPPPPRNVTAQIPVNDAVYDECGLKNTLYTPELTNISLGQSTFAFIPFLFQPWHMTSELVVTSFQ
jgi:hypothetical protein